LGDLATETQEDLHMTQPMATDLSDWGTMEQLMGFVVYSKPTEPVKEVADDGREAENLKEASRKNRRLRLSRKKG
jgi:hypothetical protein